MNLSYARAWWKDLLYACLVLSELRTSTFSRVSTEFSPYTQRGEVLALFSTVATIVLRFVEHCALTHGARPLLNDG